MVEMVKTALSIALVERNPNPNHNPNPNQHNPNPNPNPNQHNPNERNPNPRAYSFYIPVNAGGRNINASTSRSLVSGA